MVNLMIAITASAVAMAIGTDVGVYLQRYKASVTEMLGMME